MDAERQPIGNELTIKMLALVKASSDYNDDAKMIRWRVAGLLKTSPYDVLLHLTIMGLNALEHGDKKIQEDWLGIKNALGKQPSPYAANVYINAGSLAMFVGEADLAVAIQREAMQRWPLDHDIFWHAGIHFISLGMALSAYEAFQRCEKQMHLDNKQYWDNLSYSKNNARIYNEVGVSDEECFVLTSALFKAIAKCGYRGTNIIPRTILLDCEEPATVFIRYTAKWMNIDAARAIWQAYKNIISEMDEFPFSILEKISLNVQVFKPSFFKT